MRVADKVKVWLNNPLGIALLIGANLVGTVFGFAWYKGQMGRSFVYFWPFIGDSPMAALLCTVVLVVALVRAYRQKCDLLPSTFKTPSWVSYVSAAATLWLIQYGTWAVLILVWELWLSGILPGEGWALLVVHAGMVLEGTALILWQPVFRFSYRHVMFAGTTLYLHDFVDYVYNTFPFLPRWTMLPVVTVVSPLLTTVVLMLAWGQARRFIRTYKFKSTGKTLLRGRRIHH